MSAVELENLQPGTKIRCKDGEEGIIHGVYMSNTGIVFTVKTHPTRKAERNVPLADIVEIIDG